MASDTAILEVLEADLRSLCNEARKTDSLATQITGWLQHTNSPQIKDCAERALVIVRATAQEGRGIEGIKTKEILRPFLLACQSRNPRLVGTVLGSVQRLLAHGAVSDDGRQSIIEALHQVERTGDDTVKLKILQTALTLLQNPSNVDDQEGAGMVLSICMLIYSHNKSSPTIASTATATIRQAVALLFDHAVIAPSAAGSSVGTENEVALGREVAAVRLLQDLLNMCSGSPPSWLNCPLVGRHFLLDLLEFVLLHRPAVFQSNNAFKALLQTRLAPMLEELCRAALEPDMEPASCGEVKVLLRCVGALLKKHSQLVPQVSVKLLVALQSGCAANRMAWQRVLSLQVLRWLVSDPQVLYILFSTFDMSIDCDRNPINEVAYAACEVIRVYMRAAEANDEELLAALSGMYRSKQSGKEQAMDVDSIGPGQGSQVELWVLYLAVELLVAIVAAFETLTDANIARSSSSQQSIIATAADGAEAPPRTPVLSGSRHSSPTAAAAASYSNDAPFGPRLSNSGSLSRALKGCPLAAGPVYTLAGSVSKQLLPGFSLVLTRCRSSSTHEALLMVLLRSCQVSAQCAGALGDVVARDRFLTLLCEVSIAPAPADEARAARQGGDAWPNVHALRTLFNAAKYLADSLGPSWMLVVEVLYVLDRALPAAVAASSGKVSNGLTPDAKVSLMLALSEVSSKTLAASQLYGFQAGLAGPVAGGAVGGPGAAAGAGSAGSGATGGVGGVMRMPALIRMVEVLLHNLDDDVEHMLLVALESVYKEEREPDVRMGLLRVALHVLQRHGDGLSRGWVPLLRLFEAVPSWEESSTISAAFQCVESVSSDFLPTMPKVHLDRALEVLYLSDLSEAECVELLVKLFTHLRKISMDPRPEVRNSGVRTLFLAVGSQAAKFSPVTWRYCLWEILFPLVAYVHVMADTSSNAEAAAVELGKERGKAVMMLMHHSRNSEQKQWDETTVLALNGLGKVLKANMATVLGMPGFDEKWDEICGITAKMLGCGRRSVAVAAAQLLTGYLQSYKPLSTTGTPAAGHGDGDHGGCGFPWKRTLQAIDDAVKVMAVPNTRVPLQARSELLTGLSAVYVAQAPEGAFDLPDMQMLLHWLSDLARHPTGADDVTPVPGVLPPVQKLVLQILGHFNTVDICCHQVRATLFGPVVGSLGECASLRHLLPEDPLWQRAASGLVAVINAGLPAGMVWSRNEVLAMQGY
eukprot:gene11566-11710_t